jgi:hypothetical protein
MKDRMKSSNKLRAYWSKAEKDMMFYHPKKIANAKLLAHYFSCIKCNNGDGETTLIEELDKRGFDISTLKFSIAYKEEL